MKKVQKDIPIFLMRAEMYLHIVFPDIWPAFEAAKAQRTNSLAGKWSSDGTPSRLQKLRKRERAKEYPAIVEAERLFQRVLSSKLRVLVEKKGVMGLGGSECGGLKSSSLQIRVLVGEVLTGRIFECFNECLLIGRDGLLYV
jgi:hypothetical protein